MRQPGKSLAWDGPAVRDLIGLREIADLLGVCPEALDACVRGHRRGYCDMPAPVVVIAGTRGWHRDEVEPWLDRSRCVAGRRILSR